MKPTPKHFLSLSPSDLAHDAEKISAGRDLAMKVFRVTQIRGSSSLAGMFDNRPKKGSLSLKPGKKGSAFVTHASETRRAQYSRELIHPDDFGDGAIRRAISSLPGMMQQWINVRYRPTSTDTEQSIVIFARMFMAAYLDDESRKLSRKVIEAVRTLAEFQIRQCIFPYLSLEDVTSRSPRAVLGQTFSGIGQSNWDKTYRRHWININHGLRAVDGATMVALHSKYLQEI